MDYKYNSYYYWENILLQKRDVWKCNFMNKDNFTKNIFVKFLNNKVGCIV